MSRNLTRLQRLEDERADADEEETTIEVVYVNNIGEVVQRLPAITIRPGEKFDYWRTVGRMATHDWIDDPADEADT